MQDLSRLAANSLATDSEHGGNQVWDRSSMSAPGGDSGNLGEHPGENVVIEAPRIDEIDHTRTVLHPEGPPVNGNPFPRFPLAGPREWVKGADQLSTSGQAPAGTWDDDHRPDVPPQKQYGGSSNHA